MKNKEILNKLKKTSCVILSGFIILSSSVLDTSYNTKEDNYMAGYVSMYDDDGNDLQIIKVVDKDDYSNYSYYLGYLYENSGDYLFVTINNTMYEIETLEKNGYYVFNVPVKDSKKVNAKTKYISNDICNEILEDPMSSTYFNDWTDVNYYLKDKKMFTPKK